MGEMHVSFSQELKEELMLQVGSARHCQIAELAALISWAGVVTIRRHGGVALLMESENRLLTEKAELLMRRSFKATPESGVSVSGEQHQSRFYLTAVMDREDAARILMAVKYMNRGGVLRELEMPVQQVLLRSTCCRRAYIRGAFLAGGSVSDPNKYYHLEIVCSSEDKARQLMEVIHTFGVDARMVQRKGTPIVYVKDSEGISDMFNIMGAHKALMAMENIKILREISGNVNRSVNCETANLNKTVTAAVEQIQAIEKIRDNMGFGDLPPALREMAQVRLDNPDVPLKDLGGLLDPPVGKSGVNHRLRKLRQIADEIPDCRQGEGINEEEKQE